MGVPAHDQRDFEFARKYALPVVVVIQPDGARLDGERLEAAYLEEGRLADSGEFTGTASADAVIRWPRSRRRAGSASAPCSSG